MAVYQRSSQDRGAHGVVYCILGNLASIKFGKSHLQNTLASFKFSDDRYFVFHGVYVKLNVHTVTHVQIDIPI